MHFLYKALVFIIPLTCTLCFGAVPRTTVNINQDNFSLWVGNGYTELPEPVTTEFSKEIWDIGANQFNVHWSPVGGDHGDCRAIYGSSGFSVKILGVADNKIEQGNINVTAGNPVPITTKAWISIEQTGGTQTQSKTQIFQCDLEAKTWWPQDTDYMLVAKVFVNINIPPPSCSLSVQSQLVMPTLSTSSNGNKEAKKTLPITVNCNNVSGIHYIPKVDLTLSTSSANEGNHVYDDDSITLKMLYGDDSSKSGEEWTADGSSNYSIGEILDGATKTVTPEVDAIVKSGAQAEKYDVNVTVMMNFK
ncbi:hypothetical protein EDF78_11915 [Rahnella sp. BIGb0236]|nr:hypothetical protein EDF78_11915 [Rahnella sp. BIGb0236]